MARHTPLAGVRLFIIAVNCTEPSATCFCVSAGGGPDAGTGFDLALTELTDSVSEPPRYLAVAGSDAGRRGARRAAARAGRATTVVACRTRRRRGRREPHGAGAARGGPARDARGHPGGRALGRRGEPLPDLRQLHDGLPDLLLHLGHRHHRPDRRPRRALAALGLLLRGRLLVPARRCGPHVHRAAATGSGSPTSSAPGTTSSASRAVSDADGASSGARWASTSPKRRTRSRGRRRLRHDQRPSTWSPPTRSWADCRLTQCTRLSTWAVAREFAGRRTHLRRGRRRRPVLADRRRTRPAGCAPPGPGLRARRVAGRMVRCWVGRGCSRPTAGTSARRRSSRTDAVELDGAGVRADVRRRTRRWATSSPAGSCRSSSTGCRRPGSGCSTSTDRHDAASARSVAESSMTPVPYRVVERRQETADTATLTLEARGDALPTWAPGQFTMVYAFGVGEIPISVSGGRVRPDPAHGARGRRGQPSDLCGAGRLDPRPARTVGRGWPAPPDRRATWSSWPAASDWLRCARWSPRRWPRPGRRLGPHRCPHAGRSDLHGRVRRMARGRRPRRGHGRPGRRRLGRPRRRRHHAAGRRPSSRRPARSATSADPR